MTTGEMETDVREQLADAATNLEQAQPQRVRAEEHGRAALEALLAIDPRLATVWSVPQLHQILSEFGFVNLF